MRNFQTNIILYFFIIFLLSNLNCGNNKPRVKDGIIICNGNCSNLVFKFKEGGSSEYSAAHPVPSDGKIRFSVNHADAEIFLQIINTSTRSIEWKGKFLPKQPIDLKSLAKASK